MDRDESAVSFPLDSVCSADRTSREASGADSRGHDKRPIYYSIRGRVAAPARRTRSCSFCTTARRVPPPWTSTTSTRQTTGHTDSSSGTNGYRSFLSPCTQDSANSTQASGPLTHENVFEYFATSMFYDKQSNNQVLRMQTMHTGLPLLNEAEELK